MRLENIKSSDKLSVSEAEAEPRNQKQKTKLIIYRKRRQLEKDFFLELRIVGGQ